MECYALIFDLLFSVINCLKYPSSLRLKSTSSSKIFSTGYFSNNRDEHQTQIERLILEIATNGTDISVREVERLRCKLDMKLEQKKMEFWCKKFFWVQFTSIAMSVVIGMTMYSSSVAIRDDMLCITSELGKTLQHYDPIRILGAFVAWIFFYEILEIKSVPSLRSKSWKFLKSTWRKIFFKSV